MDFSCEKLKSFTAGISLRFVYINAVFQFPNIFLYMDIRQLQNCTNRNWSEPQYHPSRNKAFITSHKTMNY